MKVKEEREKAGSKPNIQKAKIVATSPITSWQIDGEKWKRWQVLSSWAPKSLQMVPAAMKLKDACSLEGEFMTNPDSVLLNSKGLYSQSYNFSVVMYECENWTIKKAEWWRNDAFVLWCWKRLLRVPWRARRPNQSILKEIHPEYSLKGLMLKLKLQ